MDRTNEVGQRPRLRGGAGLIASSAKGFLGQWSRVTVALSGKCDLGNML
ncbi:hypothetical protein MMMB2_0609 [Mycobacterium marinum MB2]|nr:hypothetical protein MMMB2_0609 [Mycobacterium marinum MB2]